MSSDFTVNLTLRKIDRQPEECVARKLSAAISRRSRWESKRGWLKRDARVRLRIGTPKEDVMRFFKENGLPVSLDGDEYEGTVAVEKLHEEQSQNWL